MARTSKFHRNKLNCGHIPVLRLQNGLQFIDFNHYNSLVSSIQPNVSVNISHRVL